MVVVKNLLEVDLLEGVAVKLDSFVVLYLLSFVGWYAVVDNLLLILVLPNTQVMRRVLVELFTVELFRPR